MPSLLMRGAFDGALYVAAPDQDGSGAVGWTPDRLAAHRFAFGEAAALQARILAREPRAVALVPESLEQRERLETLAPDAW